MSSELSIRTASKDDARLLTDVGARTFRATYRSDVESDALEAYLAETFSPERVAAELDDPASTFLLAFLDGDVIGYAHLRAGDPPASVDGSRPVELVRIYLDRAAIGRGIGSALMDACLERADEDGYEIIWLGVWELNERARGFYRKWGFREIGSQEFPFGDAVHADVVMVRGVNGA